MPTKKGTTRKTRLPLSERRAQILETAYDFFAENGLSADTRALAQACGISQRLLYRAFPSKAALLDAVYEAFIAGPVKAIWFVQLRDRTKSVEERLTAFCRDYYGEILTSRWLRLFLSAALSGTTMVTKYMTDFVTHLLEITVEEVGRERGLQVPEDRSLVLEIGWILHGAVTHLAMRHHIYQTNNPTLVDDVIALHVKCFISGIKDILPSASPR